MLRFFQEDETPQGKDAESTTTPPCVQKLGAYLVEAGIVDKMTLLVAMANPHGSFAIQLMRMVAGMIIEVVVASRKDILEAIVR